jgi:hypothetical protein
MAWGRAVIGGTTGANGDSGGKVVNGDTGGRRVNVLATGSVDLSIKVCHCTLDSWHIADLS